jgi:peptide deformylase
MNAAIRLLTLWSSKLRAYNSFSTTSFHGAPAVRIIKYPHPTLRHKSKPLRRVDAELRKMIREMFDLMYEHKGIGLAANQVDLPYRLFIINLTGEREQAGEEHVFINPVIVRQKGMVEDREGCLSFPEIYAPVQRPEKVVLNAFTMTGQEVTYELNGMFARAVQHEADHLEGKLFIDRLTPASRLTIKEELATLERQFQEEQRLGIAPEERQVAARLAELESART